MTTARRMRFVHAQLAVMLGTALVLTAIGSLSVELFFLCSLIGLLILVEGTAPVNVAPRWRGRLPWLVALGMVGFALYVGRRLLEILPPEVLTW